MWTSLQIILARSAPTQESRAMANFNGVVTWSIPGKDALADHGSEADGGAQFGGTSIRWNSEPSMLAGCQKNESSDGNKNWLSV